MKKKGLFDDSDDEGDNEYVPQDSNQTEIVQETVEQTHDIYQKQEDYSYQQSEPPKTAKQIFEDDEEETYVPHKNEPKEQENQYKPIEENNQIDSSTIGEPEQNVKVYPPSAIKEEKSNTIVVKKPQRTETKESEEGVTEAELKLKEETERAKNELLSQIKSYQNEDFDATDNDQAEEEDPKVQKFSVSDPVKSSGHVKYTVTGVDDEGEFKQQRRYREFAALSQELKIRWPGCYVPAIPEKKLINNNETQFVDERRVLLERFMKECAKYDYIIYSKEFKLFARGTGDYIDKMLLALPRQTPLQVLEKYRLNFKIDDEAVSTEQLNSYSETILKFLNYLKKAIGVMEMQKKQLKQMTSVRDKHDKSIQELTSILVKYENIGISYYSNEDYNKRILTHPNHNDFESKVQQVQKKTKNPYKDAYLWMKGEYLDALGMFDCLQGREQVMRAQLQTSEKMESDKKELNKLKDGKTTFKSLLKSKTQKESQQFTLQQNIEIAEQEVQDFKQLINFLTIYHGKIAIPKFKAAKSKIYLKMLNSFCVKEISNAHSTATLFHSLLEIEENKS